MTTRKNAPVRLSCRNLTKTIGERTVLANATFTVRAGDRIGIVGPNGAGKTTLLRLLAGELVPDAGTLTRAPGIATAYLPQTHDLTDRSGGEAAKRVLAPIIASPANVFLLDEPTNDLDEEGLSMVEAFVRNDTRTFLIVSHDRAFLDRVATRILEIDTYTHAVIPYDGGYSAYAAARDARIARAWSAYADAQEQAARMQKEVRRRTDAIRAIERKRHGAKNLPIHEKEKPVAAILRDQEGRAGRRARVLKDRLASAVDAADAPSKPPRPLPLRIRFEPVRGSTRVFDIRGVCKAMGGKAIGPIDASIQYGDRVHLTGPNGAGKTTLIRLLLGELVPDGGEIVRGSDVRIGYVGQRRDGRDGTRALAYALERTDCPEADLRKLLNRFMLTDYDLRKSLDRLSPGEYSRLAIALLVTQEPTCIILDEPTNHLDLEVLEQLETALQTFTGTLIVASHDRYFVERVGLDRTLALG